MKAISIRQPWAYAILHLGKSIENRTWSTAYRGLILIHAAKSCTRQEWADFHNSVHEGTAPFADAALAELAGGFVPELSDMPRGGIVGRARIVGCVHQSETHLLARGDKPWFCGPYGLTLDNIEPLPFRPYRGALGLFEVPDEALKRPPTSRGPENVAGEVVA